MFELVEESLEQGQEAVKVAPSVTPMPSAAQTEGVIYTMPEKFLNQPKSSLPMPLIVGGGVGLLIIVAGIATAVFLSNNQPAPVAETPTENPAPVEESATPIEPTPSTTPDAPVAPVETTPETPVVTPPAAPVVLANAADVDADGLSDIEEGLYKTDASKPDTDSDGYSDGSEVRFLFDPTKPTSAKLSSAATIARYRHPSLNYSFIYPATWDVRSGTNTQQVTISTANDESILVDAIDAQGITDLNTWLTQNAAQFVIGTAPLKTGAQWLGFMNEDGTEGYLVRKNSAGVLSPYVYHVKYVAGIQNQISFRATFEMIVASMVADQ